jgi:RNA binding exosome subunit
MREIMVVVLLLVVVVIGINCAGRFGNNLAVQEIEAKNRENEKAILQAIRESAKDREKMEKDNAALRP